MTSDRFVNRDQAYLRDEQYATGARLDARTRLHALYSTAPVPFFVWMQRLIEWPADAEVLEVGCGTGLFWTEGRRVENNDLSLTLTDLSPGMLAETAPKVAPLVRDKRVKYREDIVDGLDAAPSALIGLFEGRNFGKMLVRVSDFER